MNIEQRLNQMERQIKRQRIGLFVLAAALCGMVSMAATESEVGHFEELRSKTIHVEDLFVSEPSSDNERRYRLL